SGRRSTRWRRTRWSRTSSPWTSRRSTRWSRRSWKTWRGRGRAGGASSPKSRAGARRPSIPSSTGSRASGTSLRSRTTTASGTGSSSAGCAAFPRRARARPAHDRRGQSDLRARGQGLPHPGGGPRRGPGGVRGPGLRPGGGPLAQEGRLQRHPRQGPQPPRAGRGASIAHGEDAPHRPGRDLQGQAGLTPAVRRSAALAVFALVLVGAAFSSPRFVPFDMDEFAGYHALGCAAHPLSRQFHVFREGCGQYGLTPPLVPVSLPLRSYLYIGSLPVLTFYPFWKVLDDPVAVRVQGALFLLAAVVLAARLVGTSWPRTALAAFVFPLFVGSFLVDTGPVGLQLVLLFAALILLERAAAPGGSPLRDAAIAGFLCFLGVWIKLVFVWLIPATIGWSIVQFRRSPRSFRLASVAFLACFVAPSAVLLLSRDAAGLPYYEVLSVGRFSLEPQSMGTVAAGLFAYVRDGSSLAPRSVFFPDSVLDALP